MTTLLVIHSNFVCKITKMDELKESQLKQKTKAQLIDGFLAFKRKVNNETIVSSKIFFLIPIT